MITLDGSQGEGGGQILRSALALSIVTGQPFRIERIRARRSKPGLLRQHLTAVQAAREISAAKVTGAALGSGELTFVPGPVRPGTYHFAVGTAGSASLVLQTVLPPLLLAPGSSQITLEGGTHNPFAPPVDFLEQSFLPIINQLGPAVSLQLERHGFYPAGGGRFTVTITPAAAFTPIELLERGEISHRHARALVAHLPAAIGRREIEVVQDKLGWPEAVCKVKTVTSNGPGNTLILEIGDGHHTEVFTGFGERGVPAETVARRAADEACTWLRFGVPVGEHLADQLLLPFALAGAGAFRTGPLSRHASTNLDIVQRFLDIPISIESSSDKTVLVRVGV